MVITFLYRFDGSDSTPVEEYIREYERRYPGKDVAQIDTESVQGTELAELYGIMQYPAVVVTRNDGQLEQMWQGNPLPLIDEIVALAIA